MRGDSAVSPGGGEHAKGCPAQPVVSGGPDWPGDGLVAGDLGELLSLPAHPPEAGTCAWSWWLFMSKEGRSAGARKAGALWDGLT